MNLQQIIKNQQLKKDLQNRKQDRIKKKLQAKQRDKVNLDHSHLKSGKIQKTKIIQKKKFKTQVQKSRKIQVKVQDNVNPSTFVAMSQEYITIFNRTQNYVKFDDKKIEDGCAAISAYAEANKQNNIILQITMQSPIECNSTPVMLRVPYADKEVKCIVITNQKQEIEAKSISEIDMRILDLKQFSQKMKKDKKFKRQVIRKTDGIKVFCDMKTFSNSKMVKNLILKGIPVFPIDLRKVPYSLQQQIISYKNYLKLLISSVYFVAKSGDKHRICLKNRQTNELKQNIVSLVHQMVSRLIQKNKGKGNRLTHVSIKSESSIPIDIYG